MSPNRGRPPVDTEMVRSRLPRDLIDELDAHAKETGGSRPNAVRSALREWRRDKVSGVQAVEGFAAAIATMIQEFAASDADVIGRLTERFASDAATTTNPGTKTVFSAIAGALADGPRA